ncbi:MAX gene-associated protein isoform X3 [Moschus berezovskii]|uniref:MAX gene-associated protein isoform X3 n=1 Tax=Moschus berezovskii TaxID=68408 RepID=UPI002444FE31|nr:MAX gene-associated protein isoform X3 [Moschus berezovskii]
MEEKQQIILANQDGGTVPGAAPTFFVILKQPGNGKTDQGILVTNRDACALANSVSSPGKSKGKICLPADCTVGGITVTLDNNSMWNEFYHRSTEMILTKQGRRMFPYCRYWITGLDSNMKYILVMDISPVDNHRYKWNGRWWEPSGKAEPHVLGRVFIHPESPSTGHYWMHQPVSFYKLKLTNNTLDQEGHIILHSMHRYLPRLHLVPAEKATEVIQLNGPGVHTFTFPQTEFFAVTAYQNIQITQLKIDYNPFAKGFRDDGLNSKPQRDGKQKNSSDQEGNSVPSSPGQRVRFTEGEGSEMQLTDLDPLSRGQETSGKGLEKPSLNIKQDFLGFMDIDSALGEVPQLKQEISESLGNSFEDGSHVISPLNPNENFNVVVKEEPLDDYEYELGECPEGVTVKQEETDEETDVYSNSDDDPILEKQLKRHNKADDLEADHPSSKWQPNSPSGVAKAKMFKLDAGKMPVVYLEPCAVTKSTVKVSELPDNMLSTSRKDRSSLLTELDYLPAYIENSNETGFCLDRESENDLGRHSPDIRVVQKYPLLKEAQWKYPDISDSVNTEKLLDGSKSSVGDSFLGKEDLGRKKTMLKISAAPRTVNANQNAPPNVPGKRGRPRKLKLSKAGRPPKTTGRSLTSTKNTLTGPGSTFPDVKPDLEDVDGVLFVSFESKEALDIHAVDGTNEESCSLQASAANDPGCRARISQLEKELIEDLKALRHKQVIHPGLQEVGLKLNSVDPTMSIDLKYLGVQLPLAPATSFPFWNLTGANPASPDGGFPFVSRTGKTNDFTKIKGWRGKFHSASASRNEGGNSEGPLKNRSAFCSDKLDEYLENEGKLMETSMGFSSNAPTSPVVYQLPTKSTSYVRTLDSVLKKQSIISPSTSYSLKPHSVPSVSRKTKSQNKQATFSGRTKSSYKSILPYPVSPKQKHTHMIPGDKINKNSSSTTSENRVNNLIVPTLDENAFPKQISLRQAQQQQQQQQQQQGSRPPGLSKSQVKLMDLEDCALWEGKPRTYITEERADVSLTTLLTAQASLKTKPIHTIIRKRAPPCNNDFCRLGCVCSSLALEKRQPAHCRRPDCMFGCTCLKRKVVLVKGGSKTKHFQRKSAHRDPVFYDNLGEEPKEEGEEGVKEEEEQLKEKKKRKKLEYTICETEPEQPVRHYPLWVKVEGEVDPEPVYIPTPSVIEPMKPLLLPQPEVLSTPVKGKLLTGIKPVRAYTPKPNPVIREEDKDPVYLYFESMMTCARVRVYERKKEEERQPSPSPSPSFQQQGSCHSSPENCSVKEPASEQQPLKPLTCDLEDDSDKSQEKSWKSSCNEGESASTSYVHQRSPGGPTKLIEIISDCNWEEDRNKILSILSQHINSNMPQSLKVGSFIIELASQRKSRGEKNPPVYSSRVKISMPSCQDQDDMAEKSGSETPDGPLSPGKMDDVSPVQTDALDSVRERLHGGKGLPFYAGLSPAGKLVAYKRKPSSSTSGLIQVNGKSYPQAKLLLGQMGALHPANRLAAYITGRLRPSVLDLSTLSTVISKVASNAKVAASRKPRTLLPSTSNSKTASSSGTTTNRPGKNLKAFVPAKRPIAARPSPGGVFTQFVMSKVGALQQKIPGVSTPQPLTGPQKFSIRPSPVMVVTPVVSSEPVQVCSSVTAAVTTTTPQVFLENVPAVTPKTALSDVGTKETTYSSGAGVVEVSETNASTLVTPTQSTATLNLIKTTGITTPVASVAFPKSLVASPPTITLPVASTASTSIVVVTTAASSSMVTTPTSSLSSVPIILSGIDGSPPVSQRPENVPQIPVAPPQVSPNTVKRAGPRLLLIPVQQGSPTLRPVPNTQLQGHRMVLQPVRSPSGMNLFRHPNGQIVQLLPLHQLRGSNNQPNLQPVMFRNPGSVMGIRLPTPSKPSETPPSSASPSAFSVVNPVIQAVGSSPAMNVITQAPSLLSSGPNFVSQSGTLTLRISPPEPQSFTSKTASETKITYSSGGQPVGTASLIPLQSGSFALLQLPGQKPVPSSILQHVASLQMKRESQNADQKDETSFLKREQESKTVLQSGGEAVEPETNTIKQNSGATVSEETLNDSLEDGGDHLDQESLMEERPTAVKPSEHVYSTGSHTGEDYKDVEEEYGIRNHNSSKEKLTILEVKTISGRASNMTVQSVNNVQLKKLGDVKVEQQKGLDNPEEKSNEFPIISKEESKVEFSGSRVVEQQSNPQPETKEKECGESLEKDSIRERWRKHLKGPLAQKYVRTSQEGKNETNEQLIKETKTCKENSDVFQQEHSISDLLGKSGTTENAKILKTECDSWSRISSPTTFSIVPRRAAKGSRGDGHFQGHLLLSGEQIKPKQEKTGGRNSTDFTVLELEEDDEEDENEKTDDSIDEIVDVVSDYQSEEVDDVEKNNCIEYIEDDEEQVDIETVEDLPKEISVAHMKSAAVHTEILKQPCCMPVSADEKATERSRKAAQVPLKLKPDYWSEKLQKEAEAFAYYRRTHTANERRRRGEMRDLFEKLKITLGLLHSSKVSKSLILTRAFSEIQGLTDQADKLIGQKNLLTRKRNILIRKVSSLSENTSPSNTPHTSANIVMTPQGQLLTLKGPLFSGPVVTVSPTLLEADLKPQVASSAVAQSENDDLFMMPRIVNVTSLATEGGLVDMSGSKYPHEVPDGKPPDHLKNTVRSEDNSCEDLGRISSRGNHRDVRMALGTAQVYLSHKDSGFPQIVDVSSMQEAQGFLPKKISGDTRGSQHKWKESESRRERLKTKESPFPKLKMKDLKDSSIEMELRKVASAIEEAALDPSELLTSMEDEDDTDETLTSLLNEIAFLNQQLNDDSVSLAELPSSLDTEFPGDARRAFISKLSPGNRATFQVGHLGTGLKELPDVQGESDSVSPLLLHLEDDDFSENEKQLAEPASEPDVLKIVIDSEIKDSLISHRKAGDEGKNTSSIPAEPESVSSPPILHMKGGLENNSTDTLWRPMPKLAPLGLKVANPSSDTDGQSLKVMPCLAPVAAKVGSVGHKMNLTGNDQECRESKVMPTLAPVVAKLGNTGASPSSAGK